ncbi:cation transporter [Paenibacillus alginolyticus]|uniref:heavy-metal-associated domain-containing protein n=1 Tax=Paenibacillus alginolyticus TaxID=59839 RepID=UPI0003FA4F86|nr:cation transporter [Paenibacillus alginolyticus]MCY9670603.1 cation transporter [Paenibacillus alginolyticus]
MSQLIFKVEGMSCNHCVTTIENALKQLGAVGQVDLVNKSVHIDYEETLLNINSLKEAIENKGFDVVSTI